MKADTRRGTPTPKAICGRGCKHPINRCALSKAPRAHGTFRRRGQASFSPNKFMAKMMGTIKSYSCGGKRVSRPANTHLLRGDPRTSFRRPYEMNMTQCSFQAKFLMVKRHCSSSVTACAGA
jgi:hypothetical protein